MALPEDLFQIIREMQKRIDALERASQVKNIRIPTGGKLIVNIETTDPTPQNGMIYYNSTTNKFRKCANNTWSDV